MIPYDLDPSLHAHEPDESDKPLLDDGFSPPETHRDATAPAKEEGPVLGPKSPF